MTVQQTGEERLVSHTKMVQATTGGNTLLTVGPSRRLIITFLSMYNSHSALNELTIEDGASEVKYGPYGLNPKAGKEVVGTRPSPVIVIEVEGDVVLTTSDGNMEVVVTYHYE